MRASGVFLMCACLVMLASCDLVQTVSFGKEFTGKIDESSEMDGSYYYVPFRATFTAGQKYTVIFASPDQAPVHLHIHDFDVDEQIDLFKVFIFTASAGGETDFSVYLRDDRLYGTARFTFTINEGVNGPPIGLPDQANEVAAALLDQFWTSAHSYGNVTWNNSSKAGTLAGTALVNGAFTKTQETYSWTMYTRRKYDPTTIDFSGYQNYETEAASTGRLGVSGTITETYNGTSRTTSYSGGWTVAGNLTISGLYNDRVTLSATFLRDSSYQWTGTLKTSQGEFAVNGQ